MLPARLDRFTDQSWLRADAQALAIPDKAVRPSIQLQTQRLRETLRAHGTREQPTANTLHHHAVALRIPLDPAEIIADSPGKSFDETVRSRTGAAGSASAAARMTLRPDMIADDARIGYHVLEAEPSVPRTEAPGGADALTGAWAEGSRALGSGMTHTLGGSRSVSGVAAAPMSAYADNRTAWGHAISREQYAAWAAPAGATTGAFLHAGAIGAAGSHSVSMMPGSPQAGPRAPAAVRLVTGEVVPVPAQLAAAAVAGATIRKGAANHAFGATSGPAPRETDYFSQTRSGGGCYPAAPARTPLSPFSSVPSIASAATATDHLRSGVAPNATGGSDGCGRWPGEASGNPYEMFAAPDTREAPLGPLQRRILAEGEVHVQAVAREEKAARLALLRAERARVTAHPRGVLGGDGVGNGGGVHPDLADAAARRAGVLAGMEAHDVRRRQRWLRCDDSVSRRGYDILTLERGPVPFSAPGAGQAAAAAGGAGGGSGVSEGTVVGGWYAGSVGGAGLGAGSAGGSEGSSRATTSGRSASAQNPGIRGGLRLWVGQPAAAQSSATSADDGAAAAESPGAGASDNLRRAALADGSLLAAGMHRRRTIATMPSHPLWQDTRTVLTGRVVEYRPSAHRQEVLRYHDTRNRTVDLITGRERVQHQHPGPMPAATPLGAADTGVPAQNGTVHH